MIYFFYGMDSYRLRHRLEELSRTEQTAGADKTQIDAQEQWEPEKFNSAVLSVGLFCAKRLVIIKNITKAQGIDATWIKDRLDSADADTTIIFTESAEPDKRSKLYKMLSKAAQVEVFGIPTGSDWFRVAQEIIIRKKINIEYGARRQLIEATEGNGWQLENVIDQLQLYGGARPLTEADVDEFVRRQGEGNSFQMLEAIARQQRGQVYRQLHDLWSQNEDPIKVLGAIAYQYRTLVTLKAALDQKISTSNLASRLGIHPFVVKKLTSLAQKLKWQQLKAAYNQIAQIDEALKSGKIEAEAGIEVLAYNLVQIHSGLLHQLIVHSSAV